MGESKPAVSTTVLRRAFVDICRGYSVGRHLDKVLYVRHLSHYEHMSFDDLQARYEEEARAGGALTEAEQMAKLRARGLWTDAKDRSVAVQRDTIARFEDARKTVSLPSMQVNYDKQIKEERDKLYALLNEKSTLLGFTAEVYAQRRLNDHYILTNIFSDKDLTIPFIPESSFEDMSDSEVEALLTSYHQSIEPCEDANLRRLSVQDFFTSYFNLCENRMDAFYGRAVCEMTYYQVRLGNIARYFKSLMEQTDMSKMKPEVRGDPEAIENLYLAQKNMAQLNQEGKVPANMTQEDLEATGLKKQLTNVTEELSGAELIKRYMNRAPQ